MTQPSQVIEFPIEPAESSWKSLPQLSLSHSEARNTQSFSSQALKVSIISTATFCRPPSRCRVALSPSLQLSLSHSQQRQSSKPQHSLSAPLTDLHLIVALLAGLFVSRCLLPPLCGTPQSCCSPSLLVVASLSIPCHHC
ncbi:hypothetical protein HN873_037382 [Arachis hypogaea]